MTTTKSARRAAPHTLNRVGVHKEGLQWEVKVGTPIIFSSTEWAEAEAVAQRLASRWRHAFVAFGW
jgi:phosphoglycolate phosphatase-like HAD superfamily hydrolase